MTTDRIETYQQKKRRLFGRFHHMAEYIEVLSRLLTITKKQEDVWSIVESDIFIEKSKIVKWELLYKDNFLFRDKQHLLDVLRNNIEDWNESFSFFISNSEYCGLVSISSLHEINWDFNFHDDPGGILCLESMNHKVRIILDYYMERNTELIEVSIYKS